MDVPRPSDDALAQPTRARIFALLVDLKRAAGTEEIAASIGLHPNGVRRHLERLEDDGMVARTRTHGGPGRPGHRWAIAPDAGPGGKRPTAYAELATWLARILDDGPRRLEEVEEAGREIGAELAPEPGDDPREDLLRAVTALGFQPRIESRADGFACILDNCPYRDAVRENPDLVCTLHRGLTAGLLSRLDPAARLEAFVARDPDRAGCTIEVGGSAPEA